ncbi:hypothetical protein [Emticicia sp. 17c]|uniref:hypothetical protein n=1 Tax=Emticicia sp. 17c TaxID=3127704 RepID=UPI00301C6C8F
MTLSWPFTFDDSVDSGDAFTIEEIKHYSDNFRNEIKKGAEKHSNELESRFIVNGEVRKAEFFGIKSIKKLIERATKASGGEIAGIRVYYGLAYEHCDEKTGKSDISRGPLKESLLRPRLFLVAVDKNGKDIEIDVKNFKDTPDGNGLGNGSPQPPYGQS